MPKIKDLIQVPEIRTVVRLSDVYDRTRRRSIFENFVLTRQVADILQRLLTSIRKGKGEGAFIQGHFGSGKSHLVSVLSLLFQESEAWLPILEQRADFQEYFDTLSKERYLLLDISLVASSRDESLEEIVLGHLDRKIREQFAERLTFLDPQRFIADMKLLISQRYRSQWDEFARENSFVPDLDQLSPDLAESAALISRFLTSIDLPYHLRFNRLEAFHRLGRLFEQHHVRGLIIILDELSEFLNSKKEETGFHEDIRLLQFLAEGLPPSPEIPNPYPIWVVGTVQEYIEDTAQLPQELLNKIKDRYPLRFSLTGTHIEELISSRLIKKSPPSQEVIRTLYQQYKSAFTTLPVSEERFLRLYPVHPATIDLLDDLKPLFSQQRGVVDFIYHQIRGGPSASMPGILDEEADFLLTPDRIFDHFLSRLQDRVETNPYIRVVFKYYTGEMAKILPDEEQQAIGFRLIKILILLAICPVKKRYTVRQLAESLLYKVSGLESSINYDYIREILDQLYQKGSYLKLAERGESAAEDVLAIDLEADFQLIVANKIESMKQTVAREDARIFYRLGQSVDLPHLPLGRIISQGSWPQTVKWQNTSREGRIILTQLDEFPQNAFEEILQALQQTELDFALLIGPAQRAENQKKAVFEHLAPIIPQELKPVVFFWLPAQIKDQEFMRLALIFHLLQEKYSSDYTELGRQIHQYLEKQAAANQSKIREEFTQAYFGGLIVNGYLQPAIDLDSFGTIAFARLLDTLISQGLSSRFPKHKSIAPGIEYVQRGIIQEAIETFLSRGEIIFSHQEQQGVRALIEGFLRPMELVMRTVNGFRLRCDVRKNPLIAHLISLIRADREEPFDQLYWLMRKGEWGLSRLQFELLSLCLIFSGLITPYSGKTRKPLDQITIYNLDKITAVGKGELIPPELQALLAEIPFMPKRFQAEYCLPLQEEAWNFLSQLKEEEEENILIATSRLSKLEKESELFGLAQEGFERARKALAAMSSLWAGLDTNLSARQGLSQFLDHYRQMPGYGEDYPLWGSLRIFLLKRYDRLVYIGHYLTHPGLFIPEDRSDLICLHRQIQELISSPYLFFSESCFADLESKFDRFCESYRLAYCRGHQEFSSPSLFAQYEKIRQSRQYLVLKQLARISFISVKDDLGKVDRLLSAILSRQCPRAADEQLETVPACSCGYRLGQQPDWPEVAEISFQLEQGISQYLQAFQEEEYRQRIIPYTLTLKEIGRQAEAEKIQKLLNLSQERIDPQQGVCGLLLDRLEALLEDRVIDALNEAFLGKVRVVCRDLDQLYENLIDRQFPLEKLQDILKEWIMGGEQLEGGQIYIKIITK